VFAHLAIPHEPYVYRGDCRHRVPYWPEDDRDDAAVRSAYLEQIECVNRKLLALTRVLARRPRPPIIVIQADHGHGRFGRLTPMLKDVTASQVAERIAVFAAYYLPGSHVDTVSETITPINVMRLVLRRYFGARLPEVEDASYWSGWERPYQFTKVWSATTGGDQ
jgi:hypothetical protein